ncbi:MAG TPA: hypothetical protein VIX82_17155 [Solirubrobacteraceae bacterium]
MAEGLSNQESVAHSSCEHAAQVTVSPAPSKRRGKSTRRRSGSPHSRKFLIATSTLVGLGLGALAIAVAVLISPSDNSSSLAWSQWRPPDSGLAGEREIAAEVSPFYRASSLGSQLAVVTVQNIPSSTSGTPSAIQLALRDPTSGSVAGVSGNSAVYNLCGLGPNCTVTPGPPSHARLLLLQREALELALYTFKYIDGVQNVVIILPPVRTTVASTVLSASPQKASTKTVEFAVVFSRQALTRFTSRPLNQTLPEPLPPTVDQMANAPEAELVNVIAAQALFSQQLVQTQDGSAVLVLNPVPPQ